MKEIKKRYTLLLTIKKLACIGIIAMLFVNVFVFAGCNNNYEFSEDDFELTILINSAEVSVGDMIAATATLKNISGRRLVIRSAVGGRLILMVRAMPVTQEEHWLTFPTRGLIPRIVLRNDEIVVTQEVFFIRGYEDYIVRARAFFSVGGGMKTSANIDRTAHNRTWIEIIVEKPITILGVNTYEN